MYSKTLNSNKIHTDYKQVYPHVPTPVSLRTTATLTSTLLDTTTTTMTQGTSCFTATEVESPQPILQQAISVAPAGEPKSARLETPRRAAAIQARLKRPISPDVSRSDDSDSTWGTVKTKKTTSRKSKKARMIDLQQRTLNPQTTTTQSTPVRRTTKPIITQDSMFVHSPVIPPQQSHLLRQFQQQHLHVHSRLESVKPQHPGTIIQTSAFYTFTMPPQTPQHPHQHPHQHHHHHQPHQARHYPVAPPTLQEPSPPAESSQFNGLDPIVETDCKPKKRYTLIRQLGKGGCGDVYLARELDPDMPFHIKDCETNYHAVKFVKNPKQFKSELGTLVTLNTHPEGRGMTPKLVASSKKRRALVMEYLSESLAKQFEKCNYHFSLKTIAMLALNMMDLSHDFSKKSGLVHVDIKPSNFCIGNGSDLYLIDFGYSIRTQDKLPGQTGTPLFMSQRIQTIGACNPTWQDDLESIGYVIMFFIGGGKRGLPWGGLRTHRDIAASKNDDAIAQFCSRLHNTEYAPLARPLQIFLSVTRDRSRPFRCRDDFMQLRQLFSDVLGEQGLVFDKQWDWLNVPSTESGISNSLPMVPVIRNMPLAPVRC